MTNETFRNLRIRNKGFIAARHAAKQDLEHYKKSQSKIGKELDGDVVLFYRQVARNDARYYHVAYSLVKGNKYSQIERSCNTPINPERLLEVIKANASWADKRRFDLEAIKALLLE